MKSNAPFFIYIFKFYYLRQANISYSEHKSNRLHKLHQCLLNFPLKIIRALLKSLLISVLTLFQ
jgi:hypothetical protein